jgi:hypothetical protein
MVVKFVPLCKEEICLKEYFDYRYVDECKMEKKDIIRSF